MLTTALVLSPRRSFASDDSLRNQFDSGSALLCKTRNPADVRRFYESRDFRPAWTSSSQVQAAAEVLQGAGADGLDPSAAQLAAIKANGAELELLLTDAMLTYIGGMCGATRAEAARTLPFGLPVQGFDTAYLLSKAIDRNGIQALPATLAPQHVEYSGLRGALSDTSHKASGPQGTVRANMERWRWLPNAFEDSYVAVNTADTTVKFVRGGETLLESKVITGKPKTPTPLMRAMITHVVINPPWDIPGDIAAKEIWPKERRSPGYFSRMRISASRPGGALQQAPGAHNALGRIMLSMSNPFDCYLHDTPLQSLFAKADRHLSHGCIRTEKIHALASCLLRGDPDSGLEEINDVISRGQTQWLTLPEPTPVYTLYWTASPGEDGPVKFSRDVYGWDAKVLADLNRYRNGDSSPAACAAATQGPALESRAEPTPATVAPASDTTNDDSN